MPTFTMFITIAKDYDKYESCTEAMAVYNFLKLDSSIAKMLVANKNGRPAINGVVDELEEIFQDNVEFNFAKEEVKKCIDMMVKVIFDYYGYEPDNEKPLKHRLFFKNAMSFR